MPTKRRPSRAAEIAREVNSVLGKPALKLGNDPRFVINRVPSGSLVIDRITGGGFAKGRHVELYGDEGTAKSCILYLTMALSQQRGNVVALVDPEHAFEAKWFKSLGGDPNEIILQHPETAEDFAKAIALILQKSEVEVIGIDSVAALLPREQRERDPEQEDRIAGQARFMSRALRYLTTLNQNTLVIWTNQLRTNIGAYGNPYTTPGGRALRFYVTTRIEFRRGEFAKRKGSVVKRGKVSSSEVVYGYWVSLRSVKEKSSTPFGEGNFLFDSASGRIELESELIHLGLVDGLITRNANLFSYTDIEGKDWSGLESRFKRMITDNPDLILELIEAIEETTHMGVPNGNEEVL
jgi:recombination protein RecA